MSCKDLMYRYHDLPGQGLSVPVNLPKSHNKSTLVLLIISDTFLIVCMLQTMKTK